MSNNQLNQEILLICKKILENKVGIIEASRELSNYRNGNKDLFNIFINIDSETDHFPIGEERKYWSNNALIKIDKEIKKYEYSVVDEVKDACKKLISEYVHSNKKDEK